MLQYSRFGTWIQLIFLPFCKKKIWYDREQAILRNRFTQVCIQKRSNIRCTAPLTEKCITFIVIIKENGFFSYTFFQLYVFQLFFTLVRVICIWQVDLLILSNRNLLQPQRITEGKEKFKNHSGAGRAVHSLQQLLSFLSPEEHTSRDQCCISLLPFPPVVTGLKNESKTAAN